MNLLSWILFGGVVGIAANMLDPRPSQGGIIGAIILGVAGAFLGGVVANIVIGTTATATFSFTTFAVALLGSLLLLLMGRAFRRT